MLSVSVSVCKRISISAPFVLINRRLVFSVSDNGRGGFGDDSGDNLMKVVVVWFWRQ